MARPRKNQTESAASRLIAALWDLLEDNRLPDITVSMVVARAGLNRATFYYHFASMDALIENAIEGEVVGDNAIMDNILRAIAGFAPANPEDDPGCHTRRIALLIKQGGTDILTAQVKSLTSRMWRAMLCDGDDQLTPEAHLVIDYSARGIIGIIAHKALHSDAKVSPEFYASFAKRHSEFILASISEAQGVPPETVLNRIQTTIRMRGVA